MDGLFVARRMELFSVSLMSKPTPLSQSSPLGPLKRAFGPKKHRLCPAVGTRPAKVVRSPFVGVAIVMSLIIWLPVSATQSWFVPANATAIGRLKLVPLVTTLVMPKAGSFRFITRMVLFPKSAI